MAKCSHPGRWVHQKCKLSSSGRCHICEDCGKHLDPCRCFRAESPKGGGCLAMVTIALLLIVACASVPVAPVSGRKGESRESAAVVRPTPETAARLRPVRPADEITITRVNANFCKVNARDGVTYDEGGVTRVIAAPFPCAVCFLACHPDWGDGSRYIVVEMANGDRVSIPEVWR